MFELHELLSTMVLITSFMIGAHILHTGNNRLYPIGLFLLVFPIMILTVLLFSLLPLE